jgi:UDP-N-acetylglucosamine--N-acetylmuramyl-(pentapeptide) pyrophosphoryl-undecaprenol N-acetylglucosamine transferase
MKIIVTAGGTGGHIYPALSIINKVKENKNNKYLYIGTKDRMENELVPSLGIPFKSIEIYGLTKNMVKNIKNIKCIIKAYKECLKIMKEFKPDAVIAFGGYVSFPVIMAAKKLKIKTFLHEQNVIPGKANKLLSRYADKIFISFEDSKKYFNKKKTIYSGNPCLEEASNIVKADKVKLGLDKSKKLIIIVMGSLGSSVVNEKLLDFLRSYEEKDKEIVFITGKKNYEALSNNLKVPKSTHIIPYFDSLPSLMKSADLIISRAGATTISEIIAVNIPSILIPSPYVPNNHQYYNALDMVNKGVSIMVEQKDLTKETIRNAIDEVLNDKKNNLTIIKKLKSLEKMNSSTIIYEEIKKDIK